MTKTVRSVFWSAIERLSVQSLQLILSIVIARLVLPADYGMIAMLGIFMALSGEFIDCGFSTALIQKQNRTDIDYSTVFYFSIMVGLLIYLLLFLCAPLIGQFYNESRLEMVLKVYGLTLVINSLSTVQRAKMILEVKFKDQAIISLISTLIGGGIGIYLAYTGFGVWALVFQALLCSVLTTGLLLVYTKWRPLCGFSYASFKTLFSFGSKLLAGSLLHTFYLNIYTLIIGRYYSPTELGYFSRANSIAQYPSTNLVAILSRVTFPIECQMQNDHEALQAKFFQFLRAATYIIFPLSIGLCALAEPLVTVVLTDQWLPAVPYLQITCLAYMWIPLQHLTWDLLNVKRRSNDVLRSEIVKKSIAFLILFATVKGGIIVMCLGMLVYAIIDVFIITQFTRRILPKVTFLKVLKEILPNLILASIMGLGVSAVLLLFDNVWMQLLVGGGLGCLLYVGLSKVFGSEEIKILKGLQAVMTKKSDRDE